MELVRRTVMITREQDEWLDELRKSGVSRSDCVRLAIDSLRGQSYVVVPTETTRSGKVIIVRGTEAAS
jgi:hypothetical protein